MNWAHTIAEESKYLSHAEVDLIQKLALKLPPNAACVNLGCGPGTSVIALLEARPDLACYSIDFKPSKRLDQFVRAGIEDRVVEFVGNSHTVLWEYGKIDWLFVDTNHDLASVNAEIEHWLPYTCGQVLFHDYTDVMGARNWRDVQQAVDTWAKERKPIALVDSLIVFDMRVYD